MGFEQIIGLALALLIMLVGLIGCVVPGIPGTPLVLVGAVGHRLWFGAAGPNNLVLGLMILLTVLALTFDFLASTVGAKRLGATWRGMTGAIVGAIVGLFFSLPGIILGPFLGAILFELLGGYELRKAFKAGVGAFLGLLAGAVGKVAITVMMITLFVANVLYRSIP